MLFEKRLLLLDEPTNHLDTSSKEWLVQYINTKLEGICVVIVSHDYDFLTEVFVLP
jgi:ATP-binding cassette subfamily F protein 3